MHVGLHNAEVQLTLTDGTGVVDRVTGRFDRAAQPVLGAAGVDQRQIAPELHAKWWVESVDTSNVRSASSPGATISLSVTKISFAPLELAKAAASIVSALLEVKVITINTSSGSASFSSSIAVDMWRGTSSIERNAMRAT